MDAIGKKSHYMRHEIYLVVYHKSGIPVVLIQALLRSCTFFAPDKPNLCQIGCLFTFSSYGTIGSKKQTIVSLFQHYWRGTLHFVATCSLD